MKKGLKSKMAIPVPSLHSVPMLFLPADLLSSCKRPEAFHLIRVHPTFGKWPSVILELCLYLYWRLSMRLPAKGKGRRGDISPKSRSKTSSFFWQGLLCPSLLHWQVLEVQSICRESLGLEWLCVQLPKMSVFKLEWQRAGRFMQSCLFHLVSRCFYRSPDVMAAILPHLQSTEMGVSRVKGMSCYSLR